MSKTAFGLCGLAAALGCSVYNSPSLGQGGGSSQSGAASDAGDSRGGVVSRSGASSEPRAGADTGTSAGGTTSGVGGIPSAGDGGATSGYSNTAGTGGLPQQMCAFTPNEGAEVGVVPGVTPTPSQDWTFTVGGMSVVPNTASVPIYPWFPDGHITVLPDLAGGYLMFWAEVESYRTVGPSVLPAAHTHRDPVDQLFHGRVETSDYDNGGIWLHSVFRRSGKNLLGFFVAEDQYCCPRDPQQVAWRSVGVTQSNDNGATWGARQQILTAQEAKPAQSAPHLWGGNGDGSAIWDPQNCRWMFFYQHEYVTAAVSSDPEGKPGTWLKYFNGEFSEPGLGGRDSPLPGVEAVHGGNASVHFNSYLGKWVMVYHGWDPQVSYISSSMDLIHWDAPRFLVDTDNPPGRGWYPTIIGESDLRAGEKANLYYTDMDKFGARYFKHRDITFTRKD